MAFNIIPDDLLSLNAVKLGRFLTNLDEPQDFYDDPSLEGFANSSVSYSSLTDFKSEEKDSTGYFGLNSLLSTIWSKNTETFVDIETEVSKVYKLDKSREWFKQAIKLEETRRWIYEAIEAGYRIYMVVGYKTITNAVIKRKKNLQSDDKGSVTGKVTLAKTRLDHLPQKESDKMSRGKGSGEQPKPGKISTSMKVVAREESQKDSWTTYQCKDEQIWAVQYRRIYRSWWYSDDIDKVTMAQDAFWNMRRGDRGNSEVKEKNVAELRLKDDQNSPWDKEEPDEDLNDEGNLAKETMNREVFFYRS
jgi:hypothetical protein